MKNCLMYGNCQMRMMHRVLLNTKLVDEYDITYVACYDDKLNNVDCLDISKFDLIITQPIYEHLEHKSTSSVLKNKKKDCIVIIIPSLYFNFYFLNLTYLKIENDKNVDQLIYPDAYHDKNLVNLFLKYSKDEKTIFEKYREIVLSNNFYSQDFYFKNYKKSINDLKERFLNYSNLYKDFNPIYFIEITNFIEKNYRNDLIWYSTIHPKYNPVLRFICSEILSILNRNIDLPDQICEEIYNSQLPLYQSISSSVSFNTKKYIFATLGKKKLMKIEQFVDAYLQVYRQEKNQKYLINKPYLL